MVIAIIGGGASGMAAALAAAENPQHQIVLLERQARLGRKLQATGNGRCNLSNRHADLSHYHGDDVSFADFSLSQYPSEETLEWFRAMGLYTVTEPSGKVYPYSDQANSVVDVLRFALDRPNIRLMLGCEIEKIKKTEHGFLLQWQNNALDCDRLIVACGGLAGTKLGGSMSGYQLLRSMGHHCTRLRPNLVQLKTDWGGITGLKGVRANCRAEIEYNGSLIRGSTGELQFTDCALSGPVIFEISRDVCCEKGKWSCRLDFLPELCEDTLLCELKRRREKPLPASELFTGILHNRLGRVLMVTAGISLQQPMESLSDAQLQDAVRAAKALCIPLTAPMGMDCAQVTAGGIATAEFDSKTMESRLVPGLYACGEVLDIDGDCGGYNLQWAWSSGRLAGENAGRKSE